jgi:tRNA nucleotidyltransferase (CCA-adding enzyme)
MVISFYSEINNVEVSPCSLKRKNSFGIEETQINLPVQKKLRKVFNNNNSNRTMSSSNYTLENASDIEPFVFVLNERERQLVDLFKNICDYIRQQCPEHPPITVRFVGGWVRDKLLNIECDDLDVALDTMLGHEFALYVNKYLSEQNLSLEHVQKIESNPEKSRHLETAKGYIFGQWVDFINLRTETYCEESRVPNMEFGTPEEDAFRRDITINALFYNIQTNRLEDYTGKGIEDLRNKFIRTPLCPKITFTEDPLRILRTVRFASRLNFKLADDIGEAARIPEIKQALQHKVSRSRIGNEIDKMLTGDNPVLAIQFLNSFNLLDVIIDKPETLDTNLDLFDYSEAITSLECAEWVLSKSKTLQLVPKKYYPFTEKYLRLLRFSAFLLPFRHYNYMEKRKSYNYCRYIMRTGFQHPNNDTNAVVTLQKYIDDIIKVVHTDLTDRVAIGDLITNIGILPVYEDWSIALLLALTTELVTTANCTDEMKEQILEKYVQLAKNIDEFELGDAWSWKTILDGKHALAALNMKPGPKTREIMTSIKHWQFLHPRGTSEECEVWLKQTYL